MFESKVRRSELSGATSVLSFSDSKLEKLLSVANEASRHFIEKGNNIKVPASLNYAWYNYEWCRDTAYGVMYIDDFIAHSNELGLENNPEFAQVINKFKAYSPKVLSTLWDYLDRERTKIEQAGINWDVKNESSKFGSNHVLSRFDVAEGGTVVRAKPDISAVLEPTSWLMQYDSVPLIIIATAKHIDRFGTSDLKGFTEKIRKNLQFFVDYIENFYQTPCADAWEQYYFHGVEDTPTGKRMIGKTIDSYSVSSMASGLNHASKLSEMLGIPLDVRKREKISEFLANYFISRDPEIGDFLAKSKIEYGKAIRSIGAEEIEIFNTFKPAGFAGTKIEENTVKAIEKHLFSGEMAPIRYKFFDEFSNVVDTYFAGGRWYHLALQMAQYYIDKNRLPEAQKIIDYISSKINEDGSIPEQEIPSGPINDTAGYLAKNNGKPISCLFWAETAYLSTLLKYTLASNSMTAEK